MNIEDILVIVRMIGADFHYTPLNNLIINKLGDQKEFIGNLLMKNDIYYSYDYLFDKFYIIMKKEGLK